MNFYFCGKQLIWLTGVYIFQWYMVTVVHVYNRFHSSEIRCFVNGKVVSTGETTLVHANEVNLKPSANKNGRLWDFKLLFDHEFFFLWSLILYGVWIWFLATSSLWLFSWLLTFACSFGYSCAMLSRLNSCHLLLTMTYSCLIQMAGLHVVLHYLCIHWFIFDSKYYEVSISCLDVLLS